MLELEGYILRKEAFKFDILIVICLIVVLVFVILSGVISLTQTSDLKNSMDDLSTVDYSDGWELENGVHIRINEFSINENNLSTDVPYILTKKIENVENGEMMLLHSRNLVINVYIEDEPVHITAENGRVNNLPGFENYIFADIPMSSNGKQLRLEIFKTEYAIGLRVNRILLGSGITILKELMVESIFPLILGELFFILGVGLVLLGIFTHKKLRNYMSSIYFGFFLVFMANSLMLDTAWAYAIIKNPVFIENASRINLAACIPAFIAFVDSFYAVEHYYPLKIAGIASSVFVVIIFVLGVTGIAVGASLGLIIHIIMTAAGILVAVEMLVFMVKLHWTNLPRKKLDYIAALTFILFGLIDIGMYYGWSFGSSEMIFTSLGLLFIATTTVIALFDEILEMIKLGIQAGRIGKIAFTDANTGIGNSAAFKAKFDDLEARKENFRFIGIIQFDVNNLKVINDSKGHEAGDLLIKTAANIINQSFGIAGTCYRTGGDEFVALLTGDHAPIVCEEAIYKFNKLIDKFNDNPDRPFDLRIAHGVAYYEGGKTENMTLREVHKMADDRMYSNKKMLKARYARTAEEAVIR